jgi:nucleotide-binding universal stress UspA family protein
MSGSAQSTGPVVVGIDDSAAAVTAAVWALDEALCRDARLRLVHVIRDASVDGGFAYGAAALRTARAAINDSGKLVQVEVAILYGDPATRLLSESHTAAMVCVGSAGIRPPTPMGLGATAAILAESASCPVAIIRGDHPTRSLTGPIGVVIDGSPADDAALHQAMQEARLRNASVLAMGVRHLGTNGMDVYQPEDRLRTWIQHYPDVAVQLVAAREGVIRFLADTGQSVQLVVVGGPVGKGLVGHASYPILVVPTSTCAKSLAGFNVVGAKTQ